MKEVVVILGSGLGALGALRAVSRLGVQCYCYDEIPGIESASRWYKPLPESDGTKSLLESLLHLPSSQIILIPASDAMARFAAALQESHPERFLPTLSKIATIDLIVNKSSLRRSIGEAGLPHPKSFDLKTVRDTQQIPQGEEAGFYLRPGDPHAFARIFGVRGLHPLNRSQLETFVSDILRSGFTISAQEIVPGAAESHVYLDGVFFNGEIRGIFARKRLRMHPAEFGLSSSMVSIPLDETLNGPVDLKRFLTQINFRGLFCAEFKLHNGVAKLLDLIPRAWVYIEHSDRANLNLVQPLIKCALGVEPKVKAYKLGFKMSHTELDLRALRAIHTDNWEFAKNLIMEQFNSQHFLLSPDDPLPGLKAGLSLALKGLRSAF